MACVLFLKTWQEIKRFFACKPVNMCVSLICRLNVTINYEDIKGFRVPDFILEKMKSYITTWKKQYAEEAQKVAATPTATSNRKATSNSNSAASSNSNAGNNQSITSSSLASSSSAANPGISNSIVTSSNSVETNNCATTFTTLNPPLPPPLPIHTQPPMQQPQHNAHAPPGLQNYQMHAAPPTTTTVIYDQSFTAPPPHAPHELPDMREYIHIEKPPPMYPGHSNQSQHQIQMPNPATGGYVHQNHIDPIEQALTKGDWSDVSDRSLLQYALQVRYNFAVLHWWNFLFQFSYMRGS